MLKAKAIQGLVCFIGEVNYIKDVQQKYFVHWKVA
jgi:hypothetical protein